MRTTRFLRRGVLGPAVLLLCGCPGAGNLLKQELAAKPSVGHWGNSGLRFTFRPDGTGELTVEDVPTPPSVPFSYAVLRDAPYAQWGEVELTFRATGDLRAAYRDAVRARRKGGGGEAGDARDVPEELPDRLRLQARLFKTGVWVRAATSTQEGNTPFMPVKAVVIGKVDLADADGVIATILAEVPDAHRYASTGWFDKGSKVYLEITARTRIETRVGGRRTGVGADALVTG